MVAWGEGQGEGCDSKGGGRGMAGGLHTVPEAFPKKTLRVLHTLSAFRILRKKLLPVDRGGEWIVLCSLGNVTFSRNIHPLGGDVHVTCILRVGACRCQVCAEPA